MNVKDTCYDNHSSITPFPVYQAEFWKKYWIHMRPYLLFISGTAALVGMAHIPDTNYLHLLFVFPAFFLSYGVCQAMTDVFQTDTDAISSPYRPLVRGEITKGAVFMVSFVLITCGGLIMAYINPWLIAPCLILVLGLSTYVFFKRTWWGGPPWNSWIAAMIPIGGRMMDPNFEFMKSFFSPTEASWPMIYTVLLVFFAYCNFVVAGYFKDISADRATNYNTFQVRFGWFASAVYSDILAGLSILFTYLAIKPVLNHGGFAANVSLLLLIVTAVLNIIAQIQLHIIRDEEKSNGPIATVVRSFILYCSVIIVAFKPWWIPFLVINYIMFEKVLKARPEKTQV
ncbi:MAG: UbiA family prenyltransferase [Proteobacteria bacterium]|nr:UbiA family prenyltransferase [Pseudomonadota bacterium]